MTETIPTHIPKGSMCVNCINSMRDCMFLDFTKMRVFKMYDDGVKQVICSDHK